MKGTPAKRVARSLMTLVSALCYVVFSVPALAAPEGVLFDTRQITDPQFGGAVAATVTVPQGWNLEGRASWHFQNMDKPATVEYIVKSPADDAWFNFSGPYMFVCYASNSPTSGNEARQLGRLLVPPMKPEDLIKKMAEGDRSIANVNIVRVDKLEGNAANRQKLRQSILAQTKGSGGMTDYQVEEALVHVTFTKNGTPWEAQMYLSARYGYGSGINGQYCVWDAGPFVAFQAHAGKLKDYDSLLAAIAKGSAVDPVWSQAMANLGFKLVQQRIAAAHQAAMAAQRAAQASYAQAEKNRTSLASRQSEANSRVMRGWTDTITGTDRWEGGGESHAAPTGYNYGWRGSNGKTYYTNDSTFNPNHSSSFSGDWSQMNKVP